MEGIRTECLEEALASSSSEVQQLLDGSREGKAGIGRGGGDSSKSSCSCSTSSSRSKGNAAEQSEEKITSLLNDFKDLTSEEKILFLIRLKSQCVSDGSQQQLDASTNTTKEMIDHAKSWLQENFEYDPEVAIPKEEIYGLYSTSIKNGHKKVSTADFGKLMRQVFPFVKARRLGQRGQSRYCYANIKKIDNEYGLPKLDSTSMTTETDLDWAREHFKKEFQSTKEFFEFIKLYFSERKGITFVKRRNVDNSKKVFKRRHFSSSAAGATDNVAFSSTADNEEVEILLGNSVNPCCSSSTAQLSRSQSVPIVEQYTSIFDDVLFGDFTSADSNQDPPPLPFEFGDV